jgi:hypothetical protein
MTAKWLAVAAVLAASPPPLHRAICLNRQSHPPLGVPLKISGRPAGSALPARARTYPWIMICRSRAPALGNNRVTEV